MLNRRNFLTRGATLATGMALLHPTLATASTVLDLAQRRDRGLIDPRGLARSAELRALVQKALDAAVAHGASYADVHISLQFSRLFMGYRLRSETCSYYIGVRALSDGYWGFASAPWLSDADVVRVAIDAATHAAGFGATRPARPMELAPLENIERNGDWTNPVEIIPYEVDVGEATDALTGMGEYFGRVINGKYNIPRISLGLGPGGGFTLGRTDVIDATTEGSYTVQTFHSGWPGFNGSYKEAVPSIPNMDYVARDTGIIPSLYPTSGWELLLKYPAEAAYDRWVEVYEQELLLPMKPVEVGKFDVLIDWQLMGQLLGATLGPATQLDLALGDHANGVGTSYLGPDIKEYLNSAVAASNVTVRADRSTPGGEATAKWDSEGVVPRDVELIKNGHLVTYQTGREGAGWLRKMSGEGTMQNATSAGFMGRAGASVADPPLQHLPNLTLVPDANGPSFTELLRSMKKGYVLRGGRVFSDFQFLNGVTQSDGTSPTRIYEVENGKITARVMDGKLLFRTPELWKSIIALGGAESARWDTVAGRKGEPLQGASASVSAVPALIKDATLVRR